MEYKCPKCNAILIKNGDDYSCEYCKSEYNIDYLNDVKNINYIIPFKIDKKSAIKEYKKLIKNPMLTPKVFKSKKSINMIEGIYLPCYIYNLDSTGEVEFEGSKINNWKSRGIKYQKNDVYKIIRGGNIHIKNLLILTTSEFKTGILNFIEPYDYDKVIDFDQSYIQNYKVYKADKTKEKIQKDIENRSKDIFIRKMKADIKDYKEINHISEIINLYNASKKHVLLPIWLLYITYKNKKYIYVINGQNGNASGIVPINKKKTIFIWILLFIIILTLLLLLNLLKELI